MRFEFDCRSTGEGARTTVNGVRFAESKTGRHWREYVEADEGDRLWLMDISNSGKHHCRWMEVCGGQLVTVDESDPDSSHCPVCSEVS